MKEVIMDAELVTAAGIEPQADIVIDETAAAGAAVVDEAAGDEALPARAIRNANGTITLPLRFPVSVKVKKANGTIAEEKYDRLTFHYLTGADVRAIMTAPKDMANITTFSRATKINQAVMNVLFDQLHVADINDGVKIMAFFTEGKA
ncbi:MAG: hypothetical protein DU429_07555 [Candidatus Tokpelaia sp.]|uniref:hypothetical protein n=1 Tax=Candidatus Tokpelaia sp. TaxID=2233777 RepID=UPI00123943B1|nr:hypothetical protein [Candidatus Tokpelaia sp.]KAA6204502.1 MAG: hypothetical protein DU430_08340 [Candidatus Tokpelaia sp.]KAA6205720.1 MAG: hypothetical protein DU429_07555 [Candidatus Tokpelaia sp.]KAA6405789.1 hypothetical protein DPQ22_02905 [Candidatus Tokpelaia sp.]